MGKGDFKVLPSRMAGVTAVAAESRHTFSRHTHEQFGIGVIYRGAHRSLSGRGVVEAGAGDTITVNPGEVHDGMPIGDAGRAWRMLYLNPPIVTDAIRDMSEGRTDDYVFHRPVISRSGIASQVRALFSLVIAKDEAAVSIRREEALLLLLGSVLRMRTAGDGSQSFPMAVFRAKSLMDDDPASPLVLADLASASGLSRFQLVRGFARATGLTPHAYLIQSRIHLARRLIAGGMPLAEAALASGFSDQSHMTRIFIRKYGLSPGAYAGAVG